MRHLAATGESEVALCGAQAGSGRAIIYARGMVPRGGHRRQVAGADDVCARCVLVVEAVEKVLEEVLEEVAPEGSDRAAPDQGPRTVDGD